MLDSGKMLPKQSEAFHTFFPSLKHNFIAYRSSSRPDCIFEIHQLWQSGFSRVYSNCCCSCSFKAEIIKIGQSSSKMYSNNIGKFQESTTILNAHTKKIWNLIVCTSYVFTQPLLPRAGMTQGQFKVECSYRKKAKEPQYSAGVRRRNTSCSSMDVYTQQLDQVQNVTQGHFLWGIQMVWNQNFLSLKSDAVLRPTSSFLKYGEDGFSHFQRIWAKRDMTLHKYITFSVKTLVCNFVLVFEHMCTYAQCVCVCACVCIHMFVVVCPYVWLFKCIK